jgi:transposase
MEACAGSHHMARKPATFDHDVKLISPEFVRPFVKSNKNDFVDAEAIAEAVELKNMRFVPIKTDDQLDLQAIHRVRDWLIARRTAVINQLRAFLLERGMVFAKTPAKLRMAMPEILENAENDLTPRMRNLLELLWDEWKMVEQQIEILSQKLQRIAATDAGCSRIQQIPGIGPIVATAIVAAIGNGAAFRKGREFAAWLGLVPRQYSTGGKARLMGISKPATHTCARSWCMVPELRSTASRETERQLAHGWTRWSAERTKMCSSVHLLTSWHELHGLCCPVVNRTVRAPLR